MSLFGGLMGDLEDDPIFGPTMNSHMNTMRQMNSMMSSIFNGDPFGGLFGGGGGAFDNMLTAGPQYGRMMQHPQNALMSHNPMMSPFGLMPMMGRPGLMNPMGMNMMPSSASFTSTSYVSMSSGPDGRPQIYQASSSTKTGPHGIMETKKTVQDSRTGIKKMAIGHHIGERGHIVEREQNCYEGTEEERQDFINLEEEEADDFNREFISKAGRSGHGGGPTIQCIETGPLRSSSRDLPAIMPAPGPATLPQASTSSSRRARRDRDNYPVVEEPKDQEDDRQGGGGQSEPIIELPESPSPPPVSDGEDDEDDESKLRGLDRIAEEVNPNPGRYARHQRHNILGVQPRKPIRTHQASPLATMGRTGGGAHSHKSSGSHPYNSQQPPRKPHRPMKGQYHNTPYHHNPQYERDN